MLLYRLSVNSCVETPSSIRWWLPSLLALATTPCPIRHWTGSLLLQQLCLRLALWLVIAGPCSSIVLHLPRWGVIHCSCSTVVFDSPSGVSPSLLQGLCVRLDTKIGLTRRPEIRHPFLGGGFGLGVCAGLRVFSMVRVCLFGWLFFSFVLFACSRMFGSHCENTFPQIWRAACPGRMIYTYLVRRPKPRLLRAPHVGVPCVCVCSLSAAFVTHAHLCGQAKA